MDPRKAEIPPDGVVCPYKHKCTSYPYRCGTCRNNRGRRDYYEGRLYGAGDRGNL